MRAINKLLIIGFFIFWHHSLLGRQWSGSTTVDGVISRSGNVDINRTTFGAAQLSISNTAEASSNYSSYWRGGTGGNIDSQTRLLIKNPNAGTGFLNGLFIGLDQAYAVKSYTIGTKDATPLVFYTSGKERLNIDAGGAISVNRTEFGVSELLITNTAEASSNYSSYWQGGTGGNIDSQTRLLIKNPNAGTGFLNGLFIGLDQAYAIKSYTIGSKDATPLCFFSSGNEKMRITADGSMGIGTSTPGSFKLAVEGKIYGKEVQVALTNPGPDYVFEPTYNLPSLDSVQSYINHNKHLPEVPSAKEMEASGINLSEMNMLLLKKVEELTLYMIEQNKNMIELKRESVDQRKLIEQQQKEMENLKNKVK